MFDAKALALLKDAAATHRVDWRVLAAIVEVESGGVPGWRDERGKLHPLIRWEGHYFWRRLSGAKRERAVAQGLAAPKAGAVKNPKTQRERYRMLGDASLIDAKAAFESCSWGLGQVMGAHWKALGYENVAAMVNRARDGVDGQIELMVRFIDVNGLFRFIRDGDMHAFFARYNGPGYVRQGYPAMYDRAWAKWGKEPLGEAALRQAQDEGPVRQAQDEDEPAFPEKVDLLDPLPPPEPADFERAWAEAVSEDQEGKRVPDFVVEGVLREGGSRTINQADRVERESLIGMLSALLAAGGPAAALAGALGSLHPAAQVAMIAAAFGALALLAVLWRNRAAARAIRAARVDDAVSGRNTGRLGAMANLLREIGR